MEHNPRIIELDHLPARMPSGARRALQLEGVGVNEELALRKDARSLGVTVLDGAPGLAGAAALILVAETDTLNLLGAGLESRGLREIGSAIPAVLAAYDRTAFTISFADGETIDLSGATRVMGILNVTPD